MVETYSLSKVSPAPAQKPKLEWVYGYRGKDARSNLVKNHLDGLD
jgi:hypothetical protein